MTTSASRRAFLQRASMLSIAGAATPWDAAYESMRPTLAYSRAALAATALAPVSALTGGYAYALAPALAPLRHLGFV